jgi:hypothetical protein
MTKSDQDIALDEKGQEQPKTKDRAQDPSSNQPRSDAGAEKGKYPPHQQKVRHSSDKT